MQTLIKSGNRSSRPRRRSQEKVWLVQRASHLAVFFAALLTPVRCSATGRFNFGDSGDANTVAGDRSRNPAQLSDPQCEMRGPNLVLTHLGSCSRQGSPGQRLDAIKVDPDASCSTLKIGSLKFQRGSAGTIAIGEPFRSSLSSSPRWPSLHQAFGQPADRHAINAWRRSAFV
jgi:hypothetical protein